MSYRVPLKRQNSEDVMWNALLKDGKKSPSQQVIKDAWNNPSISKDEVKKIARNTINEKLKSTEKEKELLKRFIKEYNLDINKLGTKNKALEATKKTKRYKDSSNLSKKIYEKTLKKTGGKRRKTRRKRKRRRKKRRGGMMHSMGIAKDWTGILDPNDVLKSHLINPKYLPKEMKPMAEKLANQLVYNSIHMASFQNRINELDIARRRLIVLGGNKQKIDGIKREINNYTVIVKNIENENKKIKKKLEDLSKSLSKPSKVVNPDKPFRRLEGGKKRRTRRKMKRKRRTRKRK